MFTLIKIEIEDSFREILQAELSLFAFDSFIETDTGFETSILSEDFQQADFEQLMQRYEAMTSLAWHIEEVEKQNWNQLWESQYEAIVINDKCRVRADFHEADPNFDYEIVIIPKMSFGTGHHQTTALMLNLQYESDFLGKKVADLGCGTGVLGIFALKKGAISLKACDIDDWAVENTNENAQLNAVSLEVFKGTASDFLEKNYEVVLANINRNVLLSEMELYADLLLAKGELYLSGFYEEDLASIRQKAQNCGLVYQKHLQKDQWIAAKFVKA